MQAYHSQLAEAYLAMGDIDNAVHYLSLLTEGNASNANALALGMSMSNTVATYLHAAALTQLARSEEDRAQARGLMDRVARVRREVSIGCIESVEVRPSFVLHSISLM